MECEHDYKNQGHYEDDAGVMYLDQCIKCKKSITRYVDNYFPTVDELKEEIERETIEQRIQEREARRDIRTLCYKCSMEMQNAGIKMERRSGKRSSCDKCNRQGSNWLVK